MFKTSLPRESACENPHLASAWWNKLGGTVSHPSLCPDVSLRSHSGLSDEEKHTIWQWQGGVSTQMHLGEMKNASPLRCCSPPAVASQHSIWKLKLKVKEGRKEGGNEWATWVCVKDSALSNGPGLSLIKGWILGGCVRCPSSPLSSWTSFSCATNCHVRVMTPPSSVTHINGQSKLVKRRLWDVLKRLFKVPRDTNRQVLCGNYPYSLIWKNLFFTFHSPDAYRNICYYLFF